MRPGLGSATELLQALAEREVRVVGGRIELEDALERRPRPVVLTGVVVGPSERLEDRGLVRLLAVGSLEDRRSLGKVALLQERLTALEQLVGRLAVLGRRYDPMVS